ncbi:MAG: FHA domain-containing protein [Planctomycetes bacterium]|nr:FHA domain-containing protein [Planctomycetota bacterium]
MQLVIRENGKNPREVPLAAAVVVGRSRRADVIVADEEVGREQFRIGVEHGLVVIEGLGRTNRTNVDGVPLGAGERTVVAPGATIQVGHTTFEVRDDGGTGDRGRETPPPFDQTAPLPAARPATTAPPMRPAPRPAPPAGDKPKTVQVPPQEMAALLALSPQLEQRLHVTMPRLLVKGDGLQRRIRLMKAVNKVGRAETADVLVPHESVSEQHAELRFDGTLWSLVDCGSTNGTFADGVALRQSQLPLRRNSVLGFGQVRALFLMHDAATARHERRLDDRALALLVRAGRIAAADARQARAKARRESQALAEVVLLDTALGVLDWVQALDAVRSQGSLLDRLRGLFRRPPPTLPAG